MSSRQRKRVGKEASLDKHRNASNDADSSSRTQEPGTESLMTWKRISGRLMLSVLMVFVVYWSSNKETEKTFASQNEDIKHRSQEIQCAKSYKKEILKFKGCSPAHCGRLVTDIIVSEGEAGHLLQIAKKGLAFGGSHGGASILDLHSGALSKGGSFINIYEEIKSLGNRNIFTEQDFKLYRNVRHKIQQMIAFNFGIEVNKLYLTHPTFFSEMTLRAARTIHDEYWHVHVDKETYPSFHYTSLVYLSNYGVDFTGGRFVFVDKPLNLTVEPKLGRVSAFTSGSENPHFVEKVTSGTRYALTVSFTCDKNYAIGDPTMEKIR